MAPVVTPVVLIPRMLFWLWPGTSSPEVAPAAASSSGVQDSPRCHLVALVAPQLLVALEFRISWCRLVAPLPQQLLVAL